MKHFKKVLFIVLGPVLLSLMLMWIVQLHATHPTPVNQINDRNLVDYIAKLPLHLPIMSVGWHSSILSIDLLSIPGRTNEDRVYQDLFTLAQFGLQETSNINQVLVRVLEIGPTDHGSKQLLLAMDSRKENLTSQTYVGKQATILQKITYLQSHFLISYTRKWKQQFLD